MHMNYALFLSSREVLNRISFFKKDTWSETEKILGSTVLHFMKVRIHIKRHCHWQYSLKEHIREESLMVLIFLIHINGTAPI
jgi:hypothetical protein